MSFNAASPPSENEATPDAGSTSGSGGDDIPVRPAYVDPVVAEREQKAVFLTKLLVILVLCLATTAVATATYVLVTNGEIHKFEVQVGLTTIVFEASSKGALYQPSNEYLIFLLVTCFEV